MRKTLTDGKRNADSKWHDHGYRWCIIKNHFFFLDILFIIESFLSQDDCLVILHIEHSSLQEDQIQMGYALQQTCKA